MGVQNLAYQTESKEDKNENNLGTSKGGCQRKIPLTLRFEELGLGWLFNGARESHGDDAV